MRSLDPEKVARELFGPDDGTVGMSDIAMMVAAVPYVRAGMREALKAVAADTCICCSKGWPFRKDGRNHCRSNGDGSVSCTAPYIVRALLEEIDG